MSKFQALLCDDVRVEDNGKYLAIGAYTEIVGTPSLPFEGVLSLLVVVSEVDPGDNTIYISVGPRSSDPTSNIKEFDFKATKQGRATLRFHSITVEVSEDDTIQIYCGTSPDEVRLIDEIPIGILSED